jgi:choline-sulfatase
MSQPNILYLLSDEHSFRAMGHVPEDEGGEPVYTPAFDALAAQATRFTDAYCQMPLCTPSRICQLTGKEVRKSGAWNNESVLRPELATLPGTLAAAGYATCLVGKMHLGGSLQFVGFQHRPYGDLTGKTGHQWEPVDREDRHVMRTRTAHVGVTQIPESLIQDEVVSQESLAWLREQRHARPDQPWFLCASFSRPHFPLTAPRRHFERYWPDGVTPPMVPAGGDAYDHPMSVGMRRGFRADAIDRDEMLRARAAYFGNVSYLDEVIGDFLLRLGAAGLLDNTVIVYTTDHGEMAGEHGVWWKNGWYEACTRVPLLISLPEQRTGTACTGTRTTPVGLYDLFPTLCGLAGVDAPGDLDGVDLGPTLRGKGDPPERPIVCDALTGRWGPGTEFRMLRWRNYKYVAFRDAPPLLFDLAEDPGEQRNLIVRGCAGTAVAALAFLEAEAAASMDFEAAEQERLERDGGLHAAYGLDLPRASGNVYLFPDGRLINADDAMLYEPTVLTDHPASVFADWPDGSHK